MPWQSVYMEECLNGLLDASMLLLPQRLQNQQVSLVSWTFLDSKFLSQTHSSSCVSILLTRL